jgi:hypothetical protein
MKEGGHQLANCLTPKIFIQSIDTSQVNTLLFSLLAIVLLVFIDRIAGYFFRHY